MTIDLDPGAPTAIETGLPVADLDRSLRFYRDMLVARSAYQFSDSIRNAIVEDPDGTLVELCRGLVWE